MKTLFITGTDTDAGKSLVTAACLYGIKQQGFRVLGYKPVAAGASLVSSSWVNEDAKLLAAHSSEVLNPSDINPFCFQPAIAPHIAAQQVGQTIQLDAIIAHLHDYQRVHQPDLTLVEGAGGWKVPLHLLGNTLADLPKQQRWPVILVVGMKLGCLNHALLTAEAMISDGVGLVGWIANCVDANMSELEANIQSLQSLLASPCLGVVPHLNEPSVQKAWPYLEKGMQTLLLRLDPH